jgi:lipopolysaccharide export system permease protein
MFGTTIQRMIFAELVRVFLLALATLTSLFLLAGLVAEATQRGLAPSQILTVIPLLIPNTLPYTVPSTTLFATCVVYGRLAHDNEITAIKAAGVHLGRLVTPALILGLLTCGGTLALYWSFIPSSHLTLRTQVLSDVEEYLYGLLKRQGCLRHQKLDYAMWVRQVQGRRLVDVIFKQRDGAKGGYRMVARAREAELHFEPDKNQLRINMSYVSTYGDSNSISGNAIDPSYPMPLPEGFLGADYTRRPTDMSWPELMARSQTIEDDVRDAEEKALNPPPHPNQANMTKYEIDRWNTSWKNIPAVRIRERNLVHVEIHLRPSLALGCLIFAMVGAPVGIWFSRADYLSSFVSCFLPTVVTYYPLLLSGLNMAKEGRVPAELGLWAANIVVGIGALILYQRIVRR